MAAPAASPARPRSPPPARQPGPPAPRPGWGHKQLDSRLESQRNPRSHCSSPLSQPLEALDVQRGGEQLRDARAHPVVRDNHAIADLGVVAYLGMPISSRDGHAIGALCAIDTAPREWAADEADALRDLAHLATDEVALRELERDLDARVGQEVALREGELTERSRARRLEALGRLAGGVAHDINNVLHAASGGVRLAARRLEGDPARARRLLDTALEAMDRGAAVTRPLLSVAGRAVLFSEPVDAAAALAETREILLRGSGAVEVRVDAPEDLSPVLADRAQLGAVLRALAENARDAMPRGGILVLAATAEVVPEGLPHRWT
ncbi:sensor histidine kinase [Paracraurococcus lichenis]|uniref:GAF domain-containing protein n=1 Tax=Paracraurococcus lichenis TaxID=3064888 RepID=A0ABT9EBV9_9PROT|nr:GAF domain-containing protein [Paracraurococcus sp. LOR1-02]MDO9713561.1 GAF domain-containing protein [Paracraurococcus sp. LOR1-02]